MDPAAPQRLMTACPVLIAKKEAGTFLKGARATPWITSSHG